MSAKEVKVTDNPQVRKDIWDDLISAEPFPNNKKLPNELTAEEFAQKYEISINLAQTKLHKWFVQGKVTRRFLSNGKRRFYVYLPRENVNMEE